MPYLMQEGGIKLKEQCTALFKVFFFGLGTQFASILPPRYQSKREGQLLGTRSLVRKGRERWRKRADYESNKWYTGVGMVVSTGSYSV